VLFIARFSFVVENVALLPSLLELSDATLRVEAERRAGPLHSPTDAEPRAEILQSQVPLARGPEKARHGAESERPAGEDLVPEPESQVSFRSCDAK
jgi:hypothetical protein